MGKGARDPEGYGNSRQMISVRAFSSSNNKFKKGVQARCEDGRYDAECENKHVNEAMQVSGSREENSEIHCK